MSGKTNQQHIRNFRYETVTEAENDSSNARNSDTCFVFETKKDYYYLDGNATAPDGEFVLSANGGAGRWLDIETPSIWEESPYDGDGDGSLDETLIRPAHATVKKIELKENTRGITELHIENSGNDTNNDNYSGASIVLTASAADYTNQTFISHHGLDYYIASLAGRGAIMTDSSMVIGAYNSTDQQGADSFVSFVVGDDYWNQKEIFRLTTRGLEMPLVDKKIFYEFGTTPQADPASYTNLRCNTATGEIYATSSAIPQTQTDRFTLSGTDIGNGYIDLSQVPDNTKHLFVFYEGQHWDEGEDYTIAGQRITFTSPIFTTDKVVIKYYY